MSSEDVIFNCICDVSNEVYVLYHGQYSSSECDLIGKKTKMCVPYALR